MHQDLIISDIKRHDKLKKQYDLYLNDQYAITIHEDILINYRLFSGIKLSEGLFDRLLKDQLIQDAYLRAIKWLAIRQRTERELRVYLTKKKVNDNIIDECIHRLVNENYINDIQTSMQLAEARINKQGKGRKWVSNELMHKGVDSNLINQVISQIDEQQELSSALNIGQKKWQSITSKPKNDKSISKLYHFLSRRGYASAIILEAIQRITSVQLDDESLDFNMNNQFHS